MTHRFIRLFFQKAELSVSTRCRSVCLIAALCLWTLRPKLGALLPVITFQTCPGMRFGEPLHESRDNLDSSSLSGAAGTALILFSPICQPISWRCRSIPIRNTFGIVVDGSYCRPLFLPYLTCQITIYQASQDGYHFVQKAVTTLYTRRFNSRKGGRRQFRRQSDSSLESHHFLFMNKFSAVWFRINM